MPKNKRRAPRPRSRQSSSARRRAQERKTGQVSRRGNAAVSVVGGVVTVLVVAAVAFVVYQTGGSKKPTAAVTPPSVATAAPTLARRIDGIPCNNENISYHVHAHLQLVYQGQDVTLPANIGIDDNTCVYYLHTHDTSGELHIEAPVARKFTLGNFFDIWGQPLSSRRLASIALHTGQHLRVFLNGKQYRGNPRLIPLTAHQLISLEVGPPFVRPSGFDFQGD